ncbi:MAG TPA: transcriptional regulator, partial [Halomonas sp.]|nr:transcriptional regulator [Halomonas sp.]
MHRSVLPYLWPITTGLLLAAVLLLAFPEQLPNPFRQTPPAAVETPPALAPTTSNEQSTNRPAPDIRQAEPLARNQGPASYSDAVNQA